MSLSERHSEYVSTFLALARAHISRQLEDDGFGTLRSLTSREDEQGVWVEAEVDLQGEVIARWGSAIYERRNVVVDGDGPVDPVEFGAGLFSTLVMEDLVTCGRAVVSVTTPAGTP